MARGAAAGGCGGSDYLALAAVITQGMLGGITVLWYLPDAISIAHASLAQIVFCLTVTIALGRPRRDGSVDTHARPAGPHPDDQDRSLSASPSSRPPSSTLQILIGATMRHTGAGLAIPDFRCRSAI